MRHYPVKNVWPSLRDYQKTCAVDFETVQPFKGEATEIKLTEEYRTGVWADLTVRIYDTPARLQQLGVLAMANPLNLSFPTYPQAAYGTTVPTTKPESAVAKRARKLAEAADGVRFAEQRGVLKALNATAAQYEDSSAFLTVVSDACNKLRNSAVDQIKNLCSSANDPGAIARAVPSELRVGAIAAALTSRDKAVAERDDVLYRERLKVEENGRLRHTVDAGAIRIRQLEEANKALSDCIAEERRANARGAELYSKVCKERDNVNERNAILVRDYNTAKARSESWSADYYAACTSVDSARNDLERAKKELKSVLEERARVLNERDASRRDAKQFQTLAEGRGQDLEALTASNKELARKVLTYEAAPAMGQFIGVTAEDLIVVKAAGSGVYSWQA